MHRFSLGLAGFLRVYDYTGPLISSAQLWKWSKLIEGNAECWDGYFNFNHCLIAATKQQVQVMNGYEFENDVEEKRCLKISGFVNFLRCLGNLIEKVSRPRIYCFFCFTYAPTYSPPAGHCLQKPSQVEGPSWSTIPIVSVVWRVPVPPELLHHCMSHHQRSAGQRPDRTWHSQRKQLPSIQCWKSQILSCNEQMLGSRTDKSKRKVLPMLSTEDKYCNHIGWEISQKDADSNRKATIEDQKSKSKESNTWCLHSMLALSKNPRDLAMPFLCEANLRPFAATHHPSAHMLAGELDVEDLQSCAMPPQETGSVTPQSLSKCLFWGVRKFISNGWIFMC